MFIVKAIIITCLPLQVGPLGYSHEWRRYPVKKIKLTQEPFPVKHK